MPRSIPQSADHADAPPAPDQPADPAAAREGRPEDGTLSGQPPLLIDINGLAQLLARSAPSLQRDDAAGRLPGALWLGGSKRWRYAEIAAWVEAGCPDRRTWEALKKTGRR